MIFFVFTPYCFNPLFLKPCVISIEGIYHLHFFFLIYLWLYWAFTALWAFLQLRCVGFSLWQLLLLQSTGSRVRGLPQLWHRGSLAAALETGSIVVVHQLSCSTACGIFLDQRSNLCLLHWKVDSLPLSHQERPTITLISFKQLY